MSSYDGCALSGLQSQPLILREWPNSNTMPSAMAMFFSEFAGAVESVKNPLYLLHERLKAEGRPIVDLVRGNVNEHGIVYPPDTLKEILSAATDETRIYRPDPFGQIVAREAVASYYSPLSLPPEQIVLTPGTSISYWYCFRLFAEANEEILCPRPSYPLFDYIARLSGVSLTQYNLREDQEWAIDLNHLEDRITSKTRAIVLISPHNPTGMVADKSQLRDLADIASRYELPIISDEVFSEFLFGPEAFPRVAATSAPLVLTLNGFSKLFALPGIKLGWMGVTGEDSLVRKTLSALELISDTFLPVNEIVQFAAPAIFREGAAFLKGYVNQVRQCRESALDGLQGADIVPPKGGFYITIRIGGDEDEAASRLLEREGILVHPGYFYDIDPDHLVMTFIDDPALARSHFERVRSVI